MIPFKHIVDWVLLSAAETNLETVSKIMLLKPSAHVSSKPINAACSSACEGEHKPRFHAAPILHLHPSSLITQATSAEPVCPLHAPSTLTFIHNGASLGKKKDFLFVDLISIYFRRVSPQVLLFYVAFGKILRPTY